MSTSIFTRCFELWSAGDLPAAHAELTRIAAENTDWVELLFDSREDPSGFVDMMTTVDEEDEWRVTPLAELLI